MKAGVVVLTLFLGLTWLKVWKVSGTLHEIEALTAFKAGLHDLLGALSGWDPSTPAVTCDWRGVGCDNCTIVDLRLPRMQLSGVITSRIGDLVHLRALNLRSNSLNGTIPSSLSNHALLKSVFLQYNAFSGNLPAEIGNVSGLQILNVAGNMLSGEVPTEMPRSLKYIDLSANLFSGEIPSSSSFPRLLISDSVVI